MAEGVVAPRASTGALLTAGGNTLGWMPSDLVEQTCKRVGIAGLIFAAMWAWVLVMNNLVWRLWGAPPEVEMSAWPWPGNLLAGLGLLISLAMVGVAARLHTEPEKLLDAGLAFEVATAFLIGALNWWAPGLPQGIGVSWICVIILVYPAIVPATPGKTLTAALLAASMDPLWYAIGLGRGLEFGMDGFVLLWTFLPNYICALVAVVPVQIIRGLGRRVSRAQELGSYRLGERLGEGGMGEVYRATHRLLARPAAIKLIRPEVLGNGADGARVVVERFRREARAAAALRSPHTIELYDFGATDDGNFYYVMELLEGLNLQEVVERFGPLPAARAVHLLKQACLSLGEAHEKGLIHRDIKPSNIVACRMGMAVDFAKVLDFGLVKRDPSLGGEQTHLTSPNVTTGTPAFMAPEIALGDRPVDRRADIYALGCVAYWLLTGHNVFEAPNSVTMLMQHVQDDPVPPSERAELPVPEELDRIVLDCLAKNPEDRPGDAMELYRRLADCPVPERWNRGRALEWWRLHLPEIFEREEVAPWPDEALVSEHDAPLIGAG
jgi:serine/threonine-protein kinase